MIQTAFRATTFLVVAVSIAAGFYYVAASEISLSDTSPVAIGAFHTAQKDTPETVGEEPARLLFGGDVLLARAVEWVMDEFGSDYPYRNISAVFRDHSYTIVNFEATVPEKHVPTPAYNFNFSVDPVHLAALRESGVTHTNLANNHSFDYGHEGYKNTVNVLSDTGLVPLGKPLTLATSSITFIEENGEIIALIGIDLVERTYSEEELAPLFRYAQEQSDREIIIVHWGTEYSNKHSAQQEKYARMFVKLGADLVVGHHPHVVQDIAKIGDVLVFYSLGNLIFDQYFSTEVQEGLLISVDLRSNEVALLPVTSIGSRNQPRMMPQQEKKVFLTDLSKRSEEVLREGILEGVLTF